METMQLSEKWEDYFKREVANHPALRRDAINEIFEWMLAESALLELEGCEESKRNAHVVIVGQRLVAEAQGKSELNRGQQLDEMPQPEWLAEAVIELKRIQQESTTMPAVVTDEIQKVAPASFPALPLDLAIVTHEDLVRRSVELASQFRRNKDYEAIRDEFVQNSLALNQFGLLAPVFRDQPRVPYAKAQWKAYTNLLIDQIVVDCHWLHCRGERVTPRWPELKEMFAPTGSFNCDAIATHIAAKGWSCDFRVEELICVNNRQQTQLMQLRSQSMKKQFRALLEGEREIDSDGRSSRTKAKVSPVRMAINNWADGNHRVRDQEDMYEAIWVAMNLLGPKAKHKDIAELAALRCGVKPLSPRTVADKITTLQKVLTEARI